uniref:CII family transcriptional regulator n=1 Tax=Escherichia coli TaxID=562 RepID=UPI000AECC1C7
MERTSYSKLSQRDVDRAETDLLINLSTLTQRGLAKMIGCHELNRPGFPGECFICELRLP